MEQESYGWICMDTDRGKEQADRLLQAAGKIYGRWNRIFCFAGSARTDMDAFVAFLRMLRHLSQMMEHTGGLLTSEARQLQEVYETVEQADGITARGFSEKKPLPTGM